MPLRSMPLPIPCPSSRGRRAPEGARAPFTPGNVLRGSKRPSKGAKQVHTQTIELGAFTIDLTHMVPTDDGKGRTCRKRGERTGHVRVTINPDKLREFARKAMGSRKGRATSMHGAIVASAYNVRDTTTPA
jgi:hypothetical protein